MIFVQFDSPSQGQIHFVGKDLASVLADTNGGKEFGGVAFTGHREITEAQARALNLGYLENGIRAVKEEGCISYMLGTPVPA